jgi:osmotically-inducible protein OsmY
MTTAGPQLRIPTDEAVKRRVVEELWWDNRIDAANITVTVKDGCVVLGGTVPTYYIASAATEDALGVSGVGEVRNEISVRLPGTGPLLNDPDMAARIRAEISSDPDIDARDIQVVVNESVATLKGTVDALWKKFHAQKIAARITGLVATRNELAVTPNQSASDRAIAAAILAALKRRWLTNALEVDVRVENGKVNLTGIVPSPVVRQAVNETAIYTPAVVQVVDNLTVSPPRSKG